jgi:peptide/nickel transport system substrate-binding protein
MHSARPASSFAFIVVLGLALAACGQGSTSTQPGSSAGTATGGVVKIGIAGSPDSLNPGDGLLTEAYQLYELIYDTPINLSATGTYEPELAKSWSVAADGVTWTLELVDNATFHDGTPLTSADVKYSLELYRDTKDFPYLSSYPDVFESIEAPDPTHVVIKTSAPVGNFEYRLTFMYILPKHIWEKQADPVAFENLEMIGSGPFKLAEYKQGEFTRLAVNKTYWKGAPHVDGVIFQTIKNADARVAAIQHGDIDVITEYLPTALPALKNSANVKTLVSDPVAGGMRDIFFNQVDPANCPPDNPDTTAADPGVCSGHPALRDVEVRKALATALDKQQIIDVSQLGLGSPGLTLVPTGLGDFFATEVKDYQFSVAAANKILDDAGYKDTNGDGVRECKAGQGCKDLTFRFNYPTDIDSAPREAQLVQSMWQAIGVKVVVQGLDSDTLTSVCCPTFDYDIILWHWGSDPDPAFLLGVALCSNVTTGFSETGYCNPAYDDLYAKQGIEPDHTKRVAIVHQMQQILVNDMVYLIPFYEKQLQAYRTDRFSGWWEGPVSWGLEDPSSLTVVRPVQ